MPISRLFDHVNFTNFRVESPLAHGFPDAATFLRYDLDLDSALSRDLDNLFSRVDLEIFAGCHSSEY
ncbi:hypothetical protein V1477_018478 [Vespula maculifrons]|uniref:Uncharacterized protein n=1 Tax=Vespula maculifrons TaxID=7453 RepID=A0ABD2AVG5_VESMC